jgi:hypothetical protein
VMLKRRRVVYADSGKPAKVSAAGSSANSCIGQHRLLCSVAFLRSHSSGAMDCWSITWLFVPHLAGQSAAEPILKHTLASGGITWHGSRFIVTAVTLYHSPSCT